MPSAMEWEAVCHKADITRDSWGNIGTLPNKAAGLGKWELHLASLSHALGLIEDTSKLRLIRHHPIILLS